MAWPQATIRKKTRRPAPSLPITQPKAQSKAQPKTLRMRKPPLCPFHPRRSKVPKPPCCLRWAQRRAHSTKQRRHRPIPPKRPFFPQVKSLEPMRAACATAKPLKAPSRIHRASIAQPAIREMRATQRASSKSRPKNKRPCSAACSRFQSPHPLRQSCCSRASCLCLPAAKASAPK